MIITRRTWMQTVAAGTAVAATADLSRLLADEEAAPPTEGNPRYKKAVKIGMVQVDGDLTTKFKTLKRLGFDGVELDSPGGPTADEVQKAKDESGLIVHGVVDSVHWNKRLSDPSEEVRAEGLAALKGAIKDAKAWGATSVLLVPGRVTADATYGQCWDRSMAELKKAIPLAEELNIQILIENVWNDFLTDPKEIARYCDEAESELVGAYFDVGNCVRYGRPETWVPILGKRIKKLDIKDYGAERKFGHDLLEGDVDWAAVMAELKKLDYSGWGTAEIPGGGEERLSHISKRMSEIFAK